MRRRLMLLLPAALVLPRAADAHDTESRHGDLIIRLPFSRAAGRGGQGVGYFSIENVGTVPDRLLGASSPAAERATLHMHSRDGDVMRMRESPAIALPPGKTVKLEPGGQHVMLIGLREPLNQGDTLPLTLRFERAGEVTLAVPILAAGARGHTH